MPKQHSPSNIYAPVSSYAHAVEVPAGQRLLFLSGTMGLDPEGRVPAGFDAQIEQLWTNIERILASAGMGLTDLVGVRGFLVDAGDRAAYMQARERRLGEPRVTSTLVVCQLLDPRWLVEIEAVAAAPAR
jgi:enamine deaminase RidA (YjgF/YER057c/UK114 family)